MQSVFMVQAKWKVNWKVRVSNNGGTDACEAVMHLWANVKSEKGGISAQFSFRSS